MCLPACLYIEVGALQTEEYKTIRSGSSLCAARSPLVPFLLLLRTNTNKSKQSKNKLSRGPLWIFYGFFFTTPFFPWQGLLTSSSCSLGLLKSALSERGHRARAQAAAQAVLLRNEGGEGKKAQTGKNKKPTGQAGRRRRDSV